jgi:hypothetical protein
MERKMSSLDNPAGTSAERGGASVEPPANQWQALALLKAAGRDGDQSGFKPVGLDLGVLGGVAGGVYAAQQLWKDRKHRLSLPPSKTPDKVTKTGAKIWNNEDGQTKFVELASGESYKFEYKNHHMSQVTLPDGSYYSCNVKLKHVSPDDKAFDKSDDKPWTLHSQVNKTLMQKVETMNVSVGDDGSVHFQHKNKAEEIHTSTGFEVDLSPEREIYKVAQQGGDQWTFDYDPDHQLSRITKQTQVEKDDKVRAEVYAPTTQMGLWTESTVPGGPVSGFLNIAVRDPDTGNVMLMTPNRAIVFSAQGKSEASSEAVQPFLNQLPRTETPPTQMQKGKPSQTENLERTSS